jgi:DNA-binding NarL/FixJ family response regulator
VSAWRGDTVTAIGHFELAAWCADQVAWSDPGVRERRQARAALQRASTLAGEMGHRPLQAEIGRELPRIAAARSGDELTDAEQRVAEQIAAGATNKDAAAALFISVRTVETHVAAIYRKLGVRTRSQLRHTLSARRP